MRTIKIDIINTKVLNLLRELEQLKLIRVRKDRPREKTAVKDTSKHKGTMSKQSLNEINKQLNELRSEWQ